ncbi:hypothetical protein D3C72_1240470 [compost metagenome]
MLLGARDNPAAFSQARADTEGQPGGGNDEQRLHAMALATDEAPCKEEQPWQQADNADVVEHAQGKAMGFLQGVADARVQAQLGVVAMSDPRMFSDLAQGQLPELDAEGAASCDDFVGK